MQTLIAGKGRNGHAGQVLDKIVGGHERSNGVGKRSSDDCAAGGAPSHDTGGRILEDHAILRRKAEQRRTGQKRRGIWLAFGDATSVDETPGHGDAAGSHAQAGQAIGSAGDHGPSRGGQRSQQAEHAGQHGESLSIRKLDLLNKVEFRHTVEIGAEQSDGFDGTASMCDADRILWVYAAHQRPLGPTAFDGTHGGDEDTIHIKENSLAGNQYGGRIEA